MLVLQPASSQFFCNIPRKPLSILLSFLTECDGTSLLITNKLLATTVLPLFEIPPPPPRQQQQQQQQHTEQLVVVVVVGEPTTSRSCGKVLVKRRHRFIPFPVEDPDTLLSRLNTKRLYQRVKYYSKQKPHDDNTNGMKYCYRRNMSTEELAHHEHVLLGLLQVSSSSDDDDDEEYAIDQILRQNLLPAHLELLRFRKNKGERLPFSTTATSTVGVTLLASYPRSGNSLLRSLLERMTGRVTGSDTRPDRTLSQQLARDHNMVGEGIVATNKVLAVKSHFPERRGWKVVRPHRIILLTRNPFDAIDSYFHMALTNTHTKTLADSVYLQYATMFDQLSISEIQTWKQFHNYWLLSSSSSNNNNKVTAPPLLVVRYEDLILRPHESMMRVIAFMLGTPLTHPNDRLPPFWEQRLYHVLGPNVNRNKVTTSTDSGTTTDTIISDISTGHTTTNIADSYSSSPCKSICSTTNSEEEEEVLVVHHLGSYKPRSGGTIGKSIRRFSNSLLEEMHILAGPMLASLGYNVLTQNFPNNIRTPKRERVLINYCGDNNTVVPEICVNIGNELRSPDNPYGRNITSWRKNQTMGDSIPMPTK